MKRIVQQLVDNEGSLKHSVLNLQQYSSLAGFIVT